MDDIYGTCIKLSTSPVMPQEAVVRDWVISSSYCPSSNALHEHLVLFL